MGTFSYIIRDTARLLCRHWGVSVLTLLTAAAMYFLVGASTMLAMSIRHIAADIESDLVVQAFSQKQEGAAKVLDLLKTDPSIAQLTVISPDQAMERLRARMGAQARAVTMVGDNPLPWTVEIQVRNAPAVSAVVQKLSPLPEVDDLVYAGTLAERLINISSVISKGTVVILVISLLVSSLVLYNTIRIGVYSRRHEIAVMLLVGATKRYVASPFVLQGMVLGFLGSLLAVGMLHGGYSAVIQSLRSALPFLNLRREMSLLMTIDQTILSAGFLTGWFCSAWAAGRYVKRTSKPL